VWKKSPEGSGRFNKRAILSLGRRDPAKRSKRGRFGKARREVANVRFHRRMPEPFEMKKVHLFQSALRGPVLKCNAIGGDEYAGTIVAQPTMHVHFFFRLLLKKREELNEFLVLGRRPAAGTNVYKAHTLRFRALSLRSDRALPLAAKIDDGGDADFFQLLDALLVGLRAAVEKLVDLAHVRDTTQLDFFGKGRTRRMSRIAGAGGTRAPGNEKRSKKQSKNLRAQKFHKERAFNHLDGNCKCKVRREMRRKFQKATERVFCTGNPPLDIDIQEIH
jgi:hypothetical protein